MLQFLHQRHWINSTEFFAIIVCLSNFFQIHACWFRLQLVVCLCRRRLQVRDSQRLWLKVSDRNFPYWNFKIWKMLQEIIHWIKFRYCQFCRGFTLRAPKDRNQMGSPLDSREKCMKFTIIIPDFHVTSSTSHRLNMLRMNGKGINKYLTENSKFKRKIIWCKSIQIASCRSNNVAYRRQ